MSFPKSIRWVIVVAVSLVIVGALLFWISGRKSTGFTDELRYMPKGGQYVVSIDVQAVLKSKFGSDFVNSDAYKQINKLVEKAHDGADIDQFIKDKTGLKWGEARRVTLFGSYFSEEGGEPNLIFVIKTENAKKFKPGGDSSTKSLVEEKVGGYTIFADNRFGYCVVDDGTIVWGQAKSLREVLRRDNKPEISKTLEAAMKEADFSNPVAAAFDLKDIIAESQKHDKLRSNRYNDVNAPGLTPEEKERRQFYADLDQQFESEIVGLFDWSEGAAFRMTLGSALEAKATLMLKPELGGSPNVSMQIDYGIVLKIVQDTIEFQRADEKRSKRMGEFWEKRRKKEKG